MKTGTKMSNASERIKGYCTEVRQDEWPTFLMMMEGTKVKIGELVKTAGTWDGERPFFVIQSGQLFSSRMAIGDVKSIPHFVVEVIQEFGITPTITRAEAEAQLGKRIID